MKDLRQNPNHKHIVKKIKFSYKSNPDKFRYYYNVWDITEQNAHLLDNIELRGTDYHLDHIIPISFGYNHYLDPSLISDISNLRIIDAKFNMNKCAQITPEVESKMLEFNINIDSLVKRPTIRKPKSKSEIEHIIKEKITHDFIVEDDITDIYPIVENKHSLLYYEAFNRKNRNIS